MLSPALRARALLALGEGRPVSAVAREFGLPVDTVKSWRRRYGPIVALPPELDPDGTFRNVVAAVRDGATALEEATRARRRRDAALWAETLHTLLGTLPRLRQFVAATVRWDAEAARRAADTDALARALDLVGDTVVDVSEPPPVPRPALRLVKSE